MALLRKVATRAIARAPAGPDVRIHRIASDTMAELGYSSKLNAEWEFLPMLRDEGRRSAEAFLAAHGNDLGARSTLDLDGMLDHMADADGLGTPRHVLAGLGLLI